MDDQDLWTVGSQGAFSTSGHHILTYLCLLNFLSCGSSGDDYVKFLFSINCTVFHILVLDFHSRSHRINKSGGKPGVDGGPPEVQ